jgi:hypothetical protein
MLFIPEFEYNNQYIDFDTLSPSVSNKLLLAEFIKWDYKHHPTNISYNYVYNCLKFNNDEFNREIIRLNNLSVDEQLKLCSGLKGISSKLSMNLPTFYISRSNQRKSNNDNGLGDLLLSLGIQGCVDSSGEIQYSNNGVNTGNDNIPSSFTSCPSSNV